MSYMTMQGALPRGPHNLSPDEVRASQRTRIFDAVLDLVAENGYHNVTATSVVRTAGISKSSFYALFDDLDDAFVEACSTRIQSMFHGMLTSGADAGSATQAMIAGKDFMLKYVHEERALARSVFVELPSVGDPGSAVREQAHEVCRRAFELSAEWFRRENPELPKTLPEIELAVSSSFIELLSIAAVADDTDTSARIGQAMISLWVLATTGSPMATFALP